MATISGISNKVEGLIDAVNETTGHDDSDLTTAIYRLVGTAVDISLYQTKTDENLETENKTIVDAINEVNAKVGTDGVGIANIAKTATNDLVDTYTITLTDESTYSFTVTNGKVGADGKDGKDGVDGTNGTDGKDGVDGKDGYTPVKGTDYFTEEDIAEITAQVASPYDALVKSPKWVLNDAFDTLDGAWAKNIDFNVKNKTFDQMRFEYVSRTIDSVPINYYALIYRSTDGDEIEVYSSYTNSKTGNAWGWLNPLYQTVIVEDVNDTTFADIGTQQLAKETLETESKTIIGAINELHGQVEELEDLVTVSFGLDENTTYADLADKLQTDENTIIGAINELHNRVVKGAYYNSEDGKWYKKMADWVWGKVYDGAINIGSLKFHPEVSLIDLSAIDITIDFGDADNLIQISTNTIEALWDLIPENTQVKILNIANTTIEDVKTGLQNGIDAAQNWINDTGKKVETWVDNAVDNITETANEIIEDTKNKVEVIEDALENFGSCSSQWGQNLYDNLTDLFVGNDVVEDTIQKAMTDTTHDGLTTTDKTIIGAINEVNATVQVDANVNAITTLNNLCGISGITDLTGTAWTLEAGAWTASAGFGTYMINADVVVSEALALGTTDLTTVRMYIGQSSSGDAENYIGFYGLARAIYYYDNTTSFAITITGGTSVQNTDLINWLYQNGRLNTSEAMLTDKKTLIGAINELHEEMAEIADSGVEVDTSNLQTKTDDSLETESKEIVGAINELHDEISNIDIPEVDLSPYQTVEDEDLNTTAKTVIGAINELNSKVGESADCLVPTCSTSNNGQFLMVVDGVPTWTTVPNAEGSEF